MTTAGDTDPAQAGSRAGRASPKSAGTRRTGPSPLLLVDFDRSSHLLLQKALRRQSSAWRLECCLSIKEALEHVSANPPDAVLIGMSNDGALALHCTRRLKLLLPSLPIVIFTECAGSIPILLFLMAGASGYLIRPISEAEILRALTEVRRGGTVLCRRTHNLLGKSLREGNEFSRGPSLTSRQEQLMGCLFRRLSDKKIADEFGVGSGTVHAHLAQLYAKLDVHRRGDAVRAYLSRH